MMETDWSYGAVSMGCQGRPGATSSWKRQEGSPASTSSGSMKPTTPRLQTSGLQDCETINVYGFKPPVCGASLHQPQETYTDGQTEACGGMGHSHCGQL